MSVSIAYVADAALTSEDAKHLVIARRKNAFLLMNRYPYAVGHLMVRGTPTPRPGDDRGAAGDALESQYAHFAVFQAAQ